MGFCQFWETSEAVCPLFRWLQPWAAMIIDSVDVHFLREQAAPALELGDPLTVAANRQKELEAYQAAAAVVVITEEDRVVLKGNEVRARLFKIPIIVPIRVRPSVARARELLFVGGFDHPPNADGLLWFVREIWPGVKAEVPEARLTVVGSNPTTDVLGLKQINGIDVIGYVQETAPYLDRAAISIAPLRYGGGMKGKVCEALASGLPVVTTSFGAQGLNAIDGEHLMIADDPEQFAECVVRLLRDEDRSEQMGRSGQSLISALCSPDAVSGELQDMTTWVASRPRPILPRAKWAVRSIYHRIARSAEVRDQRSPAVSQPR